MLKNISKILNGDLLKKLCDMGHGDELVIADANFPSYSINSNVIDASGVNGPEMLEAILSVLPLDSYATENFMLMQNVKGDAKPKIWNEYIKLSKSDENCKIKFLERFEFYERSKKAFVVIKTGERRIYGNIILKKGVVE